MFMPLTQNPVQGIYPNHRDGHGHEYLMRARCEGEKWETTIHMGKNTMQPFGAYLLDIIVILIPFLRTPKCRKK